MAGTQGLWSVDGDGLVSVADDSVLRGVVQDAARRGAVSDVFVDSCVELFFGCCALAAALWMMMR